MTGTWELAYYNPYRDTLYYRELSLYEWQQRMKELERLRSFVK